MLRAPRGTTPWLFEPMPGKRVTFDEETWAALDLLAHDRMITFQELADEAFRDLLCKHDRPTGLKEALRKSAGAGAEVVPFRRRKNSGKHSGKDGNKNRRKCRKKKMKRLR